MMRAAAADEACAKADEACAAALADVEKAQARELALGPVLP